MDGDGSSKRLVLWRVKMGDLLYFSGLPVHAAVPCSTLLSQVVRNRASRYALFKSSWLISIASSVVAIVLLNVVLLLW